MIQKFADKGGMRGAQENKYQMIPGTHENTLLNKLNRAHYFHDDPDINYYELYDLKADPHELHNIYGQKGTEKTVHSAQGNRMDAARGKGAFHQTESTYPAL